MKRMISLKALRTACLFIICSAVILFVIFGIWEPSRIKTKTILPNDKYVDGEMNEDTQRLISKAEELISRKMNEAMIPGLAAVIVKNGEIIYKAGFGYADMESGDKVTSNTLFQLGSNSKAFTALGVLQLQKEGLINVNDPIIKYIPWLTFFYDGNDANVTIQDFLHHTSGIPSRTIYEIPEVDEENNDAIEKTVRTIAGLQLVNKPGAKYEYATINYDVLALLIEKVSGTNYEDFIQKQVLDTAGLNSTYMYRSQADTNEMSLGYKIGCFSPRYYKAPRYEGNKPAGYIISNANDIAEWLKIQMGTSDSSSMDHELVEESHIPNIGVEIFDDVYYTAGWNVYSNDGTEIFHGGKNPNYSSYIVFWPEEKTGVAVLCNMKSDYTADIAQSIIELFGSSQNDRVIVDANQEIDKVCVTIISIAFVVLCFSIFSLIKSVGRFTEKKQKLSPLNKKQALKCSIWLFVFLAVSTILYFLPYLLFDEITWRFLFVWYPFTVKSALCSVYICLLLFYLNITIKVVCFPLELTKNAGKCQGTV